jgi:hypothetical protein
MRTIATSESWVTGSNALAHNTVIWFPLAWLTAWDHFRDRHTVTYPLANKAALEDHNFARDMGQTNLPNAHVARSAGVPARNAGSTSAFMFSLATGTDSFPASLTDSVGFVVINDPADSTRRILAPLGNGNNTGATPTGDLGSNVYDASALMVAEIRKIVNFVEAAARAEAERYSSQMTGRRVDGTTSRSLALTTTPRAAVDTLNGLVRGQINTIAGRTTSTATAPAGYSILDQHISDIIKGNPQREDAFVRSGSGVSGGNALLLGSARILAESR